ncbi:1-acyl-sn-glycerol-3-phosphate acyltransferase [Fructilactobacillus ixorae]|uniref:1-acyl-sn-glycerol-3-phosphate acyltransferase n=1 Tax=Fructilactobacillus ixorae TaxID=1750535 RepID=A0ABY5C3R4_9LACO|nr:1-acyl-sn-glycerol-3-phosphate acyltransferase [Fructilactobacillus ixorae]
MRRLFYTVAFSIIKWIILIFNGKPELKNQQRIPTGNYVLIATHRTWFDMLYFGAFLLPKHFYFIAKKELFKNPIVAWGLRKCNVEPVDRTNPGISVIKNPVKVLKKTDLSVLIFPSGTRHSTKLKGGAALIAKMAQVPMLPVVYQGPLTLKAVFLRQRAHINFGEPIYVPKSNKLTDADQVAVEAQMAAAFATLDRELNPNYVYHDHTKKTTKS